MSERHSVWIDRVFTDRNEVTVKIENETLDRVIFHVRFLLNASLSCFGGWMHASSLSVPKPCDAFMSELIAI